MYSTGDGGEVEEATAGSLRQVWGETRGFVFEESRKR